MSNTISSELKINVLLDTALIALKQALLPVRAFSTAFYDVPLKGTDKVSVPYFPLHTIASKDFDGTYSFEGSTTDSREVTINKRKYQPLAFTSAEIARQPKLNPEQIGMMKGQKLAEDILADILSVVTLANFGAPIFTGATSAFDSDDVIDMKTALDIAKWPKIGRSLIIDSAYEGVLLKDNDIKNAAAVGSPSAVQQGNLPTIAGFDIRGTNLLPDNGEHLVGMAVLPSGIIIGFSPIQPNMSTIEYQVVTDPETGLTLEYRKWEDPDTDTHKSVIECNYGYAAGEAAAIKRLVSE